MLSRPNNKSTLTLSQTKGFVAQRHLASTPLLAICYAYGLLPSLLTVATPSPFFGLFLTAMPHPPTSDRKPFFLRLQSFLCTIPPLVEKAVDATTPHAGSTINWWWVGGVVGGTILFVGAAYATGGLALFAAPKGVGAAVVLTKGAPAVLAGAAKVGLISAPAAAAAAAILPTVVTSTATIGGAAGALATTSAASAVAAAAAASSAATASALGGGITLLAAPTTTVGTVTALLTATNPASIMTYATLLSLGSWLNYHGVATADLTDAAATLVNTAPSVSAVAPAAMEAAEEYALVIHHAGPVRVAGRTTMLQLIDYFIDTGVPPEVTHAIYDVTSLNGTFSTIENPDLISFHVEGYNLTFGRQFDGVWRFFYVNIEGYPKALCDQLRLVSSMVEDGAPEVRYIKHFRAFLDATRNL